MRKSIADDLLSDDHRRVTLFPKAGGLDELREKILLAKRVDGTNVADWVKAQVTEVRFDQLPSIRSPWKSVWLEYPSITGNEDRVVAIADLTPREAFDDPDILVGNWATTAVQDVVNNGFSADDVTGFTVFQTFVVSPDFFMGPCSTVLCAINKHGRMLGNAYGQAERQHGWIPLDDEHILAMLVPAFYVLGFLNCRNVTVEAVEVPAKVLAKRTKKLGRRPLGFSKIRIDIPGRQHEPSPPGGSLGSEKRFHIVSGYFAHYGDCCDTHKPKGKLFGKYEGVYWMPTHVRGNKDLGTVTSTVDVRPADNAMIVADDTAGPAHLELVEEPADA